MGNNGIIENAKNASNKSDVANEKEALDLVSLDMIRNNNFDNLTSSDVESNINQYIDKDFTVYDNGNTFVIIFENTNSCYEIDEEGNVIFVGTISSTSTDAPVMMKMNDTKAFWQEDYRTKITKVETKPYINKPDNVLEEWDVSDKQDKSVMSYLLDDGNDGYILYIQSNGKTVLNKISQYLFANFTNLQTINLTNFDTSQVTSLFAMFYNCKMLKEADLSNFDTSNVTTMQWLFRACTSLESVNLSSFDTSNVKQMSYMFEHCHSLANIDVTNFNTSKVQGMGRMFSECHILTELNLESFDTSSVTDMTVMFTFCKKLKTIYVSDKFVTTSVTSSDMMFRYCTLLVGGNGTKYDAEKIDASMAHIDTPENPGYFTLKE